MNYWERWVGDWKRKTAHLSAERKGIYGELLDYLYASENPLPLDLEGLYRIAGASSASERKSCDAVLAEFMEKTESGYFNKRASEEIEKRRNYVSKQRDLANRRWSQEAEKEQAKADKKTNGAHGKDEFQIPDWVPAKAWTAWMKVRVAKKAVQNADTLAVCLDDLTKLREAGHDPEIILKAAIGGSWKSLHAPNSGGGNGAIKSGAAPWWQSNEGIKAKGAELGMAAQGNESWRDFQARINAEIEKRGRT